LLIQIVIPALKKTRVGGPAFKDIAKRYPVNKVYIEMLAHKVIMGEAEVGELHDGPSSQTLI
jgi:hypothetical protein